MLKKFAYGFGIFILVVYILFLFVPYCLTGFATSYGNDISKMIEETTGFKVKLGTIRVISSPDLSIGIKINHLEAAYPNDETFLTADNVRGQLALLPVLAKKIQLASVGADNANINLKIKKDGKFLIEDYIPQSSDNQEPVAQLPFGFKLSNHLPDISLKNYNVSFIDVVTDNSYSLFGNNFSVSDFILDKKVKISADGKFMLRDREQFKFDVKLLNKIMPDISLHELVFNPVAETEKSAQTNSANSINPIEIFNAIYQNQLTADLIANVTTFGTFDDMHFNGKADITNLGVAVDGKKLPESTVDIKLNGQNSQGYAKLYTGKDELTELVGKFHTGKKPAIDLNCKSNAKFKSVIDMIDSIAKTFGYNDLDTLSATGEIDADFSIKSDLKKIDSSGYIKVPSASFAYKLYNITVNDVFADIDLSNNSVNINDARLSVLGQPLKIAGYVTQDADADIKITADKLSIKGLLLALGQIALLKENKINSGTISLNALLKGKLDKIVPKIDLSIDNVNVKNLPSDTTVTVANSKVNLTTDGVKTNGGVNVVNAKVINPMAVISAPNAKITFGEKDLTVDSAYLLLNKSRIDLTGKVADYMTDKINFNINANGKLLASDLRSMIPADYRSEVSGLGAVPLKVSVAGNTKTQDIKFNLSANQYNYLALLKVAELAGKNTVISGDIHINGDNLKFQNTGISANGSSVAILQGGISDLYKSQKLNMNVSTFKNVTLEIPYMKKSTMVAGGNIDIGGNALNPILKGHVSVPLIKIPDLLLTMSDMSISLNGPIVKGKGTLKKFVSGGIVADNLTSDFSLKNNVFYLNNLSGDAFEGKVNGDISYNIVNGHAGVKFKGTGMNAEKAIAGGAGLKNALSGKLGFDANVTLHGATDIEMMKNLKGSANFEIVDGELGNVGRFENMIFAQNIMSNPIMKAGVESVRALPVVKDTAKFKTITGKMTFSNGWADLSPVKTSGPSMAYYITGRYNLINASANLVILGRISAEVVKLLGPLGEMSVSKLVSLIPGIGKSTVALVRAITTNPYGEKVSEIPALSSGNKNYKDFKVQFNGGVESTSSVKSFRWLSVCDTSEVESLTVKEQVQVTKQAVKDAKEQLDKARKEAVQKQVDAVNKKLEEQRQQAQEANQQMKDAVEGFKNLFKQQSTELQKSVE